MFKKCLSAVLIIYLLFGFSFFSISTLGLVFAESYDAGIDFFQRSHASPNAEAAGDMSQAARDGQNVYDSAIKNGMSTEVAQTQKEAVLKAGVDRALVKQQNSSVGFGETISNVFGFKGTTNERLGKLMDADAKYKDSLSKAYAAVGDTKQAENNAVFASGHDEVAQQAKTGVFTDSVGANQRGITFSPGAGGTYKLLAPIGTFFPNGEVDVKGGGLSGYLQTLYKIGIAIATGLALIMIVVGGLQYVSTDSWSKSSEGRKRIVGAIEGLLIVLGSYLILQQVNPNLLRSDLAIDTVKYDSTIEKVDVEFSGGTPTPSEQYPYTQDLINGATNGIPGYSNGGIVGGGSFSPIGISNISWEQYAADQINRTRILSIVPSDAARFFPNGQVSLRGWLNIIGGIIKKESNFKPGLVFREPAPLNYNSVGLLQLSQVDAEARARGYSENDLKDPYKNIEVGIKIMERQLLKDKCISCKVGNTWKGLAAYWSTIR